jgi:hypothetical protein
MVNFDLLSIVLIDYYGAIPPPARTGRSMEKQYRDDVIKLDRFELRETAMTAAPVEAPGLVLWPWHLKEGAAAVRRYRAHSPD